MKEKGTTRPGRGPGRAGWTGAGGTGGRKRRSSPENSVVGAADPAGADVVAPRVVLLDESAAVDGGGLGVGARGSRSTDHGAGDEAAADRGAPTGAGVRRNSEGEGESRSGRDGRGDPGHGRFLFLWVLSGRRGHFAQLVAAGGERVQAGSAASGVASCVVTKCLAWSDCCADRRATRQAETVGNPG